MLLEIEHSFTVVNESALSLPLHLSFCLFRSRPVASVGMQHLILPSTTEEDGLHHLWQQRLPCRTHDALHASEDRVSAHACLLEQLVHGVKFTESTFLR